MNGGGGPRSVQEEVAETKKEAEVRGGHFQQRDASCEGPEVGRAADSWDRWTVGLAARGDTESQQNSTLGVRASLRALWEGPRAGSRGGQTQPAVESALPGQRAQRSPTGITGQPHTTL